jgi:hypothetical protein
MTLRKEFTPWMSLMGKESVMSEILKAIETGEIDPNDLFLAIKDKIDPDLLEEADPDPDRDDRPDINLELYYEFYRDDEQFSF